MAVQNFRFKCGCPATSPDYARLALLPRCRISRVSDSEADPRKGRTFSYGRIRADAKKSPGRRALNPTVQCPTNHGLPKVSDSSVTI
jgi:hypothetical protein